MWRMNFRVNPQSIVAWSRHKAGTEIPVQSRHKIWSVSDCNWTRTHNHLVHKQTLLLFFKWLSCIVSTYLYDAFDCMFFSCHVRVSEWIHTLNWANDWVLVYELSGCGFESSCSYLNFRFHTCFVQGVRWHSYNYRVWIHPETRTWHDKNIQPESPVLPLVLLPITNSISLPVSFHFASELLGPKAGFEFGQQF